MPLRGDLWQDDSLQFPRLLAELEAVGAFTDELLSAVADEMDLAPDDVLALVTRAQARWDEIKAEIALRRMISMETLNKHPENGCPARFVSIHEGVGGWNSSLWSWSPCATMAAGGFYEPEQSGFTNTSLGTRLREDAIEEARHWAECEELPLYIPGAEAASRCTEQRVVMRFQSSSGLIHGIRRRDRGGNGKFLCGRIGDGWEYKGYDVEITCGQCLAHNEELSGQAIREMEG